MVNSPFRARNSRVPSRGSTRKNRAPTSRGQPAAVASSATIGVVGAIPMRHSRMISSARSSATVTGLPSAFDRAPLSRAYSSITAGPAASAARASPSAMTSSDFDGITRPRNGSTCGIFFKYPSQGGSWPRRAVADGPRIRYDRRCAAIRGVRRVRGANDHRMLAMTTLALEPMDLAALLCSRVCHDVISPVGAIVNGLEVLEDEDDAAMREVAIELIKKSAHSASARLQFCRLAFGAAGSVGASIDTGDAESVARGVIARERTSLVWNATRQLLAKNKVKLLLNLCLVASATIPRGGVMTVDLSGDGDSVALQVAVKGANARLASGVAALLAGQPESGNVDAHTIQPYFAGLVARECGMEVEVTTSPETITIAARSKALAALQSGVPASASA